MTHTHSQPPATPTNPLTTYLTDANRPRPGVSTDRRYLVLPRIVLDQLPPPVQQELAQLLAAIHSMTSGYPWPPAYRVDAARWLPIHALDEAQLRQVGLIAELDVQGELVYRDRATGRALTDDETQRPVPVPTGDPLYAHLDTGTSRR